MFKRMLAILTALVMLVTIAGVSLAETAETAKTTEPILQEIEALKGERSPCTGTRDGSPSSVDHAAASPSKATRTRNG